MSQIVKIPATQRQPHDIMELIDLAWWEIKPLLPGLLAREFINQPITPENLIRINQRLQHYLYTLHEWHIIRKLPPCMVAINRQYQMVLAIDVVEISALWRLYQQRPQSMYLWPAAIATEC